jgi:hypothetical protein
LLWWALAVDVIRFGGGSDVDICKPASDPVCALLEGLNEAGRSTSSRIEGMIFTGIFLATLISVAMVIWLGGVVGRRRR